MLSMQEKNNAMPGSLKFGMQVHYGPRELMTKTENDWRDGRPHKSDSASLIDIFLGFIFIWVFITTNYYRHVLYSIPKPDLFVCCFPPSVPFHIIPSSLFSFVSKAERSLKSGSKKVVSSSNDN